MTQIVLDASITTGWMLEDEQGPLSLSVLEAVRQDGAIAPQHWQFEVANSLLFAERRNRLRPGRALIHLQSLSDLPIEIDDSTNLEATLSWAARYELTFYDAVYLELAIRRERSLATIDGDLAQAAESAGVEIFSV